MRSYASAYKMCVPTLPRRRNRTAQSRRAGPPDHRLPNQPPSEMLPVLPERGSVVTIDVVIAVHYHAIARYSATVDLEISHSHWFKVFTSEDAHATEPVSLRCFERLRLYWHRCNGRGWRRYWGRCRGYGRNNGIRGKSVSPSRSIVWLRFAEYVGDR